MIGVASGWIALGLIPLAASLGWILRRFVRGRFTVRMRPHYVSGYGAVVLAVVHLSSSMGGMGGANATGIWLATLATLALGLQSLIGTNLQSPGLYRVAAATVASRRFSRARFLRSVTLRITRRGARFQILRAGSDNRAVVADPMRLPARRRAAVPQSR